VKSGVLISMRVEWNGGMDRNVAAESSHAQNVFEWLTS